MSHVFPDILVSNTIVVATLWTNRSDTVNNITEQILVCNLTPPSRKVQLCLQALWGNSYCAEYHALSRDAEAEAALI
jgi:hypothetical protein